MSRSLRRAVNATGVIIHTNLGRSPLGPALVEAIAGVAGSYCNLEIDEASSERTSRERHVAGLLADLAGAEAATVVNNNAAAVLLTLTALAAGRRVLCSRGELVEIGGSFRLPEVLACSGAALVEVGTTNHTHLEDYAAALSAWASPTTECQMPDSKCQIGGQEASPQKSSTECVAAIIKIHPSNFRVAGSASEVPLAALVELARARGILTIFDVGSGLVLPIEGACFEREPVVRQAIAEGADVVTFSTDKLMGGPQGGAIVGRRALIDRIRAHPLKRAVRVGKLTLAGLEAALRAHEAPGGPDTITMRLIRRPVAELEQEGRALAAAIGGVAPAWKASLEPDESSIGGGSLPGETVPTVVLWLDAPGREANVLDEQFRAHEPPIFGRFRRSRFGLDLRTLLPGDPQDILACIERLATETQRAPRRQR